MNKDDIIAIAFGAFTGAVIAYIAMTLALAYRPQVSDPHQCVSVCTEMFERYGC